MPLLLISGAIVFTIVGVSLFYSRSREKRLEGYSGVSREVFIERFANRGIPASVSGAVYDTFKKKAKANAFMPSPEMSIEEVFEQLGEDTDDDARLILKLIGIPNPTDASRESWPGQEVKTVGDMVLWVDWVRCHQ